MHPIFHTDAFVLSIDHQGEANATITLFTRELGRVTARAQGLRKPAAKLRSHLVQYAFVRVDLVRGRGLWRLVSARTIENTIQKEPDGVHARAFVRLLGLVERLVSDDAESDHVLFDHLVEASSLVHNIVLPKKYVDTLMLWKAVSILGYGADDIRSAILFAKPIESAAQEMNDEDNAALIKTVTDALHHSHL